MQILMLPFLYFKDFGKSSGVIFQAELADALAKAGANVTVLLPLKQDGWDYDVKEYFSEKVNTQQVRMAKDQYVGTGFFSDDMLNIFNPSKSPLVFDAVLNMVPQAATGIKRLVQEVGYAKFSIPIVNGFDTVSVPEEFKIRGGTYKDYVPALMHSEVLATMYDRAIVFTASEHTQLQRNMKATLAPSLASTYLPAVDYIPKPMNLPLPIMRGLPKEFKVYMGRSFGKSFEEGGNNGVQCSSVVRAIGTMRKTGTPIKLVLCTRSEIDTWAKELLAEAGDAVELVHNQTRATVLEKLRSCHIAIDLRDYDGLYMSAIEAAASGVPLAYKKSKWIEGEIDTPWGIDSYAIEDIMAMLKLIMSSYKPASFKAFQIGKQMHSKHASAIVGAQIKSVFENMLTPFSKDQYKSMIPVFEAATERLSNYAVFEEAWKIAIDCTEKGSFLRLPKIWGLKMFREFGWKEQNINGPYQPIIGLKR